MSLAQLITAPHLIVPVPPPTEEALRFYRSSNVLFVIGTLWDFLLPALFFFTGWSAKLRDFSMRVGKKWFFALAIFTTGYLLYSFLITLPLSWYAGFVRLHAYGLSSQTAAKWWSDELKALAVSLLVVPLIAWGPLLLLRKSRRWWLWSSLGAIPLIAIVLVVAPVWFDPLFNDFHAMKNKTLESHIIALADRAGIEGSRVFEVDKSVDTKTVNAYVTGFGMTKRIVIWDTAIAKLSERELLVVMGHEMGHFVLKHVSQFVWVGSLVVLFGFFCIDRTAGWALRRFQRSGVDSLNDLAAIPLLLLLFSLATFVISPALLALSRHNEHEADRFGLELTHDNYAAATAFVKLQKDNLAVPRPGRLYLFFRASHPSLGDRVDFANSYRPWEEGKPSQYESQFKTAPPHQ